MQIEIPEDTSTKVDEAVQLLGLNKQEFVDRAILLYIENISKYLELKKEMEIWDKLSDEALLNFEKAL